MNDNVQQIYELQQRLDVFLDKLKRRAQNISLEARVSTPAPSDENAEDFKNSYLAYESDIRKQMEEISGRADQIFEERFSKFAHLNDPQVASVYAQAAHAIKEFHEEIDELTEKAFAEEVNTEAEAHFQQAIADWKETAARFKCKQCSTPIAVEQLYYQAQYLPCSQCGTQTTFTPTSEMQQVPQWAEALADTRAASAKAEVERVTNLPNLWLGQVMVSFINYVLIRHQHLIDLLPGYAPTQVDSLRRAVFMEAHSKDHTHIEPAGFWEPDITYYNVMGSLGDRMKEFRAQDNEAFAAIIAGIVHDLARPECEVAAAVLDNTFTHKLWAKYSRIAHQQPKG